MFWKILYPILLDTWTHDTLVTCPGNIGVKAGLEPGHCYPTPNDFIDSTSALTGLLRLFRMHTFSMSNSAKIIQVLTITYNRMLPSKCMSTYITYPMICMQSKVQQIQSYWQKDHHQHQVTVGAHIRFHTTTKKFTRQYMQESYHNKKEHEMIKSM